MSSGCSGYVFASIGLSTCGINTRAKVGDVFRVNFTVLDNNVPPASAWVERVITIGSPCSDAENLCDDGTCSSVACDQRAMLGVRVGDKTEPPRIMLNPSLWNYSMDTGAGKLVTLTLLRRKARACARSCTVP